MELQSVWPVREHSRVEVDGAQLLCIVEFGDRDVVHLQDPVGDGRGTRVGDQPRERHDALQWRLDERVHVDDLHVDVVDGVAGGRVRVVPGVGVDDARGDRAVVDERVAVLEVELVSVGDLGLLPQIGTDRRLHAVAAGAQLVPPVGELRRVHVERARQAEDRARVAAVVRLHVVAVDLDDDGVELQGRGLWQRAGQVEADGPVDGGVRLNAFDRHFHMVGCGNRGVAPPAAGFLRVPGGERRKSGRNKDERDEMCCEGTIRDVHPVLGSASAPAGGSGKW